MHEMNLGTYYLSGTRIQWSKPLGKIRLRYGEILSLRKFLNEQLPILDESRHSFVSVDKNDLEAIEHFARLSPKLDVAEWIKLIEKHNLITDDLQVAITIRDRKQALLDYEEMLKEDHEEKIWQKWFTENDWVFGTATILDDRRVNVSNTVDYFVASVDGFIDVIEIKRPSADFWFTAKDHDNWVPHSDLTKAVTQVNNYLFELEKEIDSRAFESRLGHPVARPRALLVHGRSNTWEASQFVAQRLMNSSLVNVQVLTFDQVLIKAKRALEQTTNRV